MVKMDFKLKGITWVGNFYQKFEEVCQEVDDIVGQDAVKYLGNQVQNVGDSVKRFYSDVVQEALPLPPLVNSVKYGCRPLALINNIDPPLESIAAFTDNEEGARENPVNNTNESLHDSDVHSLTNNQHDQASLGLGLVNQVGNEISSNSSEVEDSCTTWEEVGDNYLEETSGVMKRNLEVSFEQNAVESTPQLLNGMSLNEKEPLESSIFSEQNAVESTPQLLNGMSLNETQPLESSIFSDSVESITSSEVMPSESSRLFESDSQSAKSQGSYCSETDSCKENSVDVAGCTLDSSMVLVSCTTATDVGVGGQFMTSQGGLLSCGSSQSMESNERDTSGVNEVMSLDNLSGIKHGQISSAQERGILSLSERDEPLVNSIESTKEDIQLSDDVKLEESCIFVDDMELHVASSRARRLRSYKKRIKDAFAPKKSLEKEYEQLAIWYGDSDMELSEGTSQIVLPFSSRRSVYSKNPEVQHLCEAEWELL